MQLGTEGFLFIGRVELSGNYWLKEHNKFYNRGVNQETAGESVYHLRMNLKGPIPLGYINKQNEKWSSSSKNLHLPEKAVFFSACLHTSLDPMSGVKANSQFYTATQGMHSIKIWSTNATLVGS